MRNKDKFKILAIFLYAGCALLFVWMKRAPFYLLILLYDFFRGMADDLASRVEYLRLINWEMNGLFYVSSHACVFCALPVS